MMKEVFDVTDDEGIRNNKTCSKGLDTLLHKPECETVYEILIVAPSFQ